MNKPTNKNIEAAKKAMEEVKKTRTITTKQWETFGFNFEAFLLFCQLSDEKAQKFIDSLIENFNY